MGNCPFRLNTMMNLQVFSYNRHCIISFLKSVFVLYLNKKMSVIGNNDYNAKMTENYFKK